MQDIEGLRGGLVRELGCVRVWRAELEEEGLVYCVSAARPPHPCLQWRLWEWVTSRAPPLWVS